MFSSSVFSISSSISDGISGGGVVIRVYPTHAIMARMAVTAMMAVSLRSNMSAGIPNMMMFSPASIR